MSRYIKLDGVGAFKKEIFLPDDYAIGFNDGIERIKNMPTADVEEVVRCKDCKYAKKVRNRNREDCDYICCYFRDNPDKMDVVDYYRFMVRPDGYCYRGAKMDKEKEE